MKTRQILTITVLFFFWVQFSQALPMGTEFTYQGRLIDANSPAEGEYDFIFRIYDAESDGTQAGEDVNIPDVDVIDGYFTVELDFGNIFTGEARWLEIAVREGDSNDVFTVLSPRQKITALPYALYAASGMAGARVEVGEFDGMVNSDMVETDPGGNTTINFESPFTTTEKPQFYVSVVLKQAANGLVEGVAIKAVEDIKGSANNWTGFDLTASKYSDGTSIDDMTQVYVKWIAVSKTAVSSTSSTETDIVTDSILYDSNPSYIVGIGLVKDVSSEIPPGFTLIDVTAKGRKTDLGGNLLEAPLNLYPKVNGTNIEIRVWDEYGTEYKDWANQRAHIEYTLFMKKSGGSVLTEIDNVIEDIAVVWNDVQSRYEIPAEYNIWDTGTLKIEHLPNLVAKIGGMTQALVEANVKRLAIDVECYSENSMDSYVGPCWTFPGTLSEDAGKARWFLEFKNSDGSSYSTNDWKLLKVTAYLK